VSEEEVLEEKKPSWKRRADYKRPSRAFSKEWQPFPNNERHCVYQPGKPIGFDCDLVKIIGTEHYLKETGAPMVLEKHQCRILNWMFTPRNFKLLYDTLGWSCIKKSGKTQIAAAVADAWARCYGGQIYSIANDLKQAEGRAFDRVVDHLTVLRKVDPAKFEAIIDPYHHKQIAKDFTIRYNNDAVIQAIPCDPEGEAGGMQSLTIWDELWGYGDREKSWNMWTEMQPIPEGVGNITESIRLVVTYAGWHGKSELLWNLYEEVCKPDIEGVERGVVVDSLIEAGDGHPLPVYIEGKSCVYWDHEPRMPWHTAEFLEGRKKDPALKSRTSEYARIWENRWTSGLDPFIDIKMWDELCHRGMAMGLTNHLEDVHAPELAKTA